MKLFLDTANYEEIVTHNETGLIDGVTTNPSLLVKSGKTSWNDFKELISSICKLIPGDISAEVLSNDESIMIKQAEELADLAPNVVVKLPLTTTGLKVCQHLSKQQIKTNVTLCFSPMQALMAAKAGATYVSPFIGRLNDISSDGMTLIQDIVTIYENYPQLSTQVLVASIRGPQDVALAAQIGAHAATLPPKVFQQLIHHPLTDQGLQTFMSDWENNEKK